MKRGRPFEPGNRFGRGRPKGSRNKRVSRTKFLEEHSDAILRQGVLKALGGDNQILRTLLGYILTRPKEAGTKMKPLPLKTIEELDHSSEVIVQEMCKGRISPAHAKDLSALIEDRRRVIETKELADRMTALEREQLSDSARSNNEQSHGGEPVRIAA